MAAATFGGCLTRQPVGEAAGRVVAGPRRSGVSRIVAIVAAAIVSVFAAAAGGATVVAQLLHGVAAELGQIFRRSGYAQVAAAVGIVAAGLAARRALDATTSAALAGSVTAVGV